MPLPRKAAAPVQGAAFGDLAFYSAGFIVPEGDYVMAELTVTNFQPTDQQGNAKGLSRLGVMVKYLDLNNPDPANAHEQFYSMGSKANQSWAPNPETGKGIVPVPGGPGQSMPGSTNWAEFLKSLYDSGLPAGIFVDDLSVLEGTWVHVQHIPEPEDRKGFATAVTGEAADTQIRRPGKIAVVSEIKEGGAPWEGGGGIPEVTAAAGKTNGKAVVRTAPKAAPKAAPKVAPKAAPAPAPVQDDDTETAAVSSISDVLEANADGMPKIGLRTATFKAAKAKYGDGMAQAILNTYFGSDDDLNTILGPLGYVSAGAQVRVAG